MISLWLLVPPEQHDGVIAELWEAGTEGVSEDGETLRAFFADEQAGVSLLERFAHYSPQVHPEEEHDWESEYRARWRPFPVGERFWLAPEWVDDPPPAGRLRLTIHPGMACGTGAAPATQTCLEMLERHAGGGQSVLDMGTGTGILAAAAALLGGRPVLACDIDMEAAAIARANLPARIAVFAGSLRSIRSASIDLVVANLNAETLRACAADLRRVGRASLILGGFRTSEESRIESTLGTPAQDRCSIDDWSALFFRI